MPSPTVSIIIPNYNHARYLQQRMDTVWAQSLTDYELILLDDCSTDNSSSLLEAYRHHPKVAHLVFNEANTGSPFPQWQRGIALAKGTYIWIAETDDFSHPDFLQQLVAALQSHPQAVMAFSGSHWVDDSGTPKDDLSIYKTSFVRKGQEEIIEHLSKYNTIQNVSSVLFRADALRQTPTDYTRYRACGDWILYTTLLTRGDLIYVADKLNYFRWYHSNTSNAAAKQGIWEREGIDVVALVKNNFSLTQAQKSNITQFWKQRLKPLRRSIPMPYQDYCTIHKKLFRFSPYQYLRHLL